MLKIDVKEEITKAIKLAIDNGEKALSKVIQDTGKLYRKRGEHLNVKECRALVYGITEAEFPEYHTELMKVLGEKDYKKEDKIVIAQETVNFEQKYPELWETIKDAKCLDDVYQLAREMEKTQDFMIVSEMITHLISSGKINDKEGNLVTWELPAIEMWINTMFTTASTVAEQAETVVEDPNQQAGVEESADTAISTSEEDVNTSPESPDPTKEVKTTDEPAKKSESETVPKEVETKVEKPDENLGEENTAGTDQTTDAQQETQSGQQKVENVGDVQSQESGTEEKLELVNVEVNYPPSITIPEEDKPLRELYGSKKQDFWQGETNIINRYTVEGKDKKEITHIIADKMLTISRSHDFSQCFVRNFKKEPITQLYKVVNKIANTMEIDGWIIE